MSSLMLQAGATVLLADFVSGAVQWVEDAYARPGAPLIGALAKSTTHYCVITNFLHPLLDEVMFWSRIESVIERVTGVKRHSEAEELKLLGLSAS